MYRIKAFWHFLTPSWSWSASIIRSPLTKSITLIPIAGYLILYSDYFREYLDISNDIQEGLLISNSARIFYIYWGALFVLVSVLTFYIFSPAPIRRFAFREEYSNEMLNSFSIYDVADIYNEYIGDLYSFKSGNGSLELHRVRKKSEREAVLRAEDVLIELGGEEYLKKRYTELNDRIESLQSSERSADEIGQHVDKKVVKLDNISASQNYKLAIDRIADEAFECHTFLQTHITAFTAAFPSTEYVTIVNKFSELDRKFSSLVKRVSDTFPHNRSKYSGSPIVVYGRLISTPVLKRIYEANRSQIPIAAYRRLLHYKYDKLLLAQPRIAFFAAVFVWSGLGLLVAPSIDVFLRILQLGWEPLWGR